MLIPVFNGDLCGPQLPGEPSWAQCSKWVSALAPTRGCWPRSTLRAGRVWNDPALAQQIELPPGGRHGLTLGTIDDLDAAQRFDSILYIDVLEHIAEDGAEMARAAARVRPGDGLYVHPYMPVLYFLTQAHNPTRYSYLAPGMMAGREEQQTLQALEQRPPAWVLYLPLTREEYLRVFPNAKGLNHQFIGIEQWIARNYTATGLAIGGYQLRQRRVNP